MNRSIHPILTIYFCSLLILLHENGEHQNEWWNIGLTRMPQHTYEHICGEFWSILIDCGRHTLRIPYEDGNMYKHSWIWTNRYNFRSSQPCGYRCECAQLFNIRVRVARAFLTFCMHFSCWVCYISWMHCNFRFCVYFSWYRYLLNPRPAYVGSSLFFWAKNLFIFT